MRLFQLALISWALLQLLSRKQRVGRFVQVWCKWTRTTWYLCLWHMLCRIGRRLFRLLNQGNALKVRTQVFCWAKSNLVFAFVQRKRNIYLLLHRSKREWKAHRIWPLVLTPTEGAVLDFKMRDLLPEHTSYLSRIPRLYPCKFFLAGVFFYTGKIFGK